MCQKFDGKYTVAVSLSQIVQIICTAPSRRSSCGDTRNYYVKKTLNTTTHIPFNAACFGP
jgi:hypothetical protein